MTSSCALRAEGVRGDTGHTQPLYQNPLFLGAEHAFGRTGFPVRGGPYGRTMDYAAVRCPQAERVFTTEAVSLGHALFLGPQSDMDAIAGAIEKIWQHRDELRHAAAGAAAAHPRRLLSLISVNQASASHRTATCATGSAV